MIYYILSSMRKSCVSAIFLFFSLTAWGLPYLGVDTGLLFIIDMEAAGAPNPVILQGLGVTLPFIDTGEGFFLDAGAMVFMCPYQWYQNRAIPADSERVDTVGVVFLQLDMHVGTLFKLSKELTFGVSGGPALVFPFPLFAYDNGSAYIGSMYTYFYSKFKFISLEAELLLRWAIVKDLNLTFKVRGLYPLSALWDDPAISRINGLNIQGLVSVEIRL